MRFKVADCIGLICAVGNRAELNATQVFVKDKDYVRGEAKWGICEGQNPFSPRPEFLA